MTGCFKFQLGIRDVQPIPHRGAVPKAGDQHVHVRRLNGLLAYLRWLLVSHGEVRHVHNCVPAFETADSAAATNDRSAGNRRSSEVCDKNTRLGGATTRGMTQSITAITPWGQEMPIDIHG